MTNAGGPGVPAALTACDSSVPRPRSAPCPDGQPRPSAQLGGDPMDRRLMRQGRTLTVPRLAVPIRSLPTPSQLPVRAGPEKPRPQYRIDLRMEHVRNCRRACDCVHTQLAGSSAHAGRAHLLFDRSCRIDCPFGIARTLRIPMILVSRLPKTSVTVARSGTVSRQSDCWGFAFALKF
jgi:hypothetical protein